jgi:hypothetical protein
MAQSRPWTASWFDPLLKLQDLEFIETTWIFFRPSIRRMGGDTVSLKRQHMLFEPRSGPKNRTDLSKLDFDMLRPILSRSTTDEFPDLPTAVDSSWDSYRLANDGFQLIGEVSDTLGDPDLALERHHIKSLREMYSDTLYIYVCKLRKD